MKLCYSTEHSLVQLYKSMGREYNGEYNGIDNGVLLDYVIVIFMLMMVFLNININYGFMSW